jgi:hypothetical protein
MDKFERRRLDLLDLVQQMGRGGRVRVAAAINKSPDYISRMLYPKEKAGHKGIGEDSVDLLDKAFPNWRVKKTTADDASTRTIYAVREPTPPSITGGAWPFKTIEEADWLRIPEATRQVIEQQVRAMIPQSDANEIAA